MGRIYHNLYLVFIHLLSTTYSLHEEVVGEVGVWGSLMVAHIPTSLRDIVDLIEQDILVRNPG